MFHSSTSFPSIPSLHILRLQQAVASFEIMTVVRKELRGTRIDEIIEDN